MIKLDSLTQRILTILMACLLVFFLFWHLRLSLIRYFDVDEFAHLSWTAHWVAGQRPYVDFLTFFPPGFMVFLAPAFLFGSGVTPILAARVFMFLVYLGILGSLGYLFWLMRKSWLWIAAVTLLAFIPMPKDKFIEIRPDSLATLLGIMAIIFQIRWMRRWQDRDGIITGILNMASLLVLPKMVPQVAVAMVIAGIAWMGKSGIKEYRELKGKVNMILPLVVGLIIPLGIFGIWAMSLGDLGTVFYSLTKLPVEANRISEIFIMLPNLFFYPNGIFYGQDGYPLGLKVNHIIWVVGLLVGAYRLVTPYLTRGKQYASEEILVAGVFFVHVIFYILIVPLKHTQYLIPIALFIALYAADALGLIWDHLRRNLPGIALFLFLAILGLVLLFEGFYLGNRTKLTWTNAEMLGFLSEIYTVIPEGEYVLDLDGRTLYYPYPYYACCIPFGQSAPYLTRPLPSLADALEQTQTKYIYQGELKRVDTLQPQDQAYIYSTYHSYNGDPQLLIRN